VIIAFLCFAGYTIYGKTVMKSHSSYDTTAWATVSGAIMFGIAALIENRWDELQWSSWVFWVSIGVMAILITVIAFLFYFVAVKRIGATKSGIFINLVPVFGTLASVIILGEELTWTLWVGLILISIGIGFINFPMKNNSAKLSHE
jgi:drug/metabolite transporter (DMT)-like permease